MVVIVEFSVIPVGGGVGVSRFVAAAVRELEERGVKHVTTPMSTIIEEEDLEKALQHVKAAHEAVFKAGARRVITVIKIDDRRDVKHHMEDKLKSLEKALRELSTKI
ncbi:MAG: MTH1187 family thiamine-binding protein [Nitrososphaeria archaeon]|nr:MTH1187 family thiamine-binding protein [Aigarchaeota archaeon]MCX8188010.1 MTH1187 family thiamine-binding protein [Nitrososphaeria archaeon]